MERDDRYYNALPKSLADVSLEDTIAEFRNVSTRKAYFPSPASWEDEVLYFLLLDRFSDNKEFNGFKDAAGHPVVQGNGRETELFSMQDAYKADRKQWFESGKRWCGGNLAGLKNKLGYLKRLGITAVWISPVFKQTAKSERNYHGYGIQNFLDIDPHFGTREELRDLVETAHDQGIRVILDIIFNHAGDVFAYKGGHVYKYHKGTTFPVQGFKKDQHDGQGSLPFQSIDLNQHPDAWPHGAVWPAEFQAPEAWTRKGRITDWDAFPNYIDGDFDDFKNLHHGDGVSDPHQVWDVLKRIDRFKRSKTLEQLTEVFKYWIAYADIDGYRVDTVKHMDPGATRYFTNVIHEFAQSLGKENFYIIGEITFGRKEAVNLVDTTGLDAALGIDGVQEKLEFLAKGWRVPGNPDNDLQEGYFDLFNHSLVDGKQSHQWYGKRIITMFDDHDQVGTKYKFRYCGQKNNDNYRSLPLALAVNLATLGIPCIYYGTEQAFDGADQRVEGQSDAFSDVLLRECMFGGPFGSLQSTGKHFFNEDHPIYQWISKLCTLRKNHLALRRGRQYLQKISATGRAHDFHYPKMIGSELRWVVAWSRAFADSELICAMNTDLKKPLTVWIAVAPGTKSNATVKCICSTDAAQEESETTIQRTDGFSAINITVPAGGFVVYKKI